MTLFIQRHTLISFLFEWWRETRDRKALSVLLTILNAEKL